LATSLLRSTSRPATIAWKLNLGLPDSTHWVSDKTGAVQEISLAEGRPAEDKDAP